ncbi:FimV/HubP family polar landmark protein [Paraburkholderia aspalathi]|uniref:FimV/HubP family polar landmark protein n=1 Tax=Paraburkholderia aspalathi TaxID=1324617 RepID=UPI0038BDF80F
MNLRLSSLRAMSMHQGIGRLTAMTAFAFALAGAGVGSAVAAPGDAASAPEGASVSYAAGSQYTVRPGQSLNDVAIAVTQSHDKGTLARASRALFEANPNAFMSHDPSRMRVGALLTIPALDATGAPAASAPVAGSASAASSAATAAAASAPNAAAAGAAVGAASGVAQVNAAAASAASAAAQAATPAVSGTASSTAEAGAATPGSSAAAGAVPVAGSQAAGVLPGSGAHVWSGAIQPSASEAAEGASAAATAAAGAQPASQPRAQVSSLQQLLALKNRVLMELQKHGIGGTPAAPVPPATNGAQPAAGVSSAAAASGHGSAPISTSTDAGISQTNLSIAAAIGAALVALLAALRLGRRKRVAVAATGGSLAEDAAAASARAAASQDVDSTHEGSDVSGEVAAGHAAALAPTDHESVGDEAAAREVAERVAAEREAEIRAAAAREAAVREAAERENAERAATERQAAERAEAERAAVEKAEAEHAAASQAAAERAEAERAEADKAAAARAAEDHDAAQRAAAEHEGGAHQPLTGLPAQDHDAFQHASQEIHPTPAPFEATRPSPDTEPLPSAHHENLDGATTAASLAAAAELGAEALPLTPLEPIDESFQQEVPPHRLQWDDEPASTQATPLAEPTNQPLAESWSHQGTPPPVIDFTREQAEPHTTSPFGQPHGETLAPDTSVSAVPAAQQDAAHVEPTHQPSYEPQPQSNQHAEPTTPDGAPNFERAPITPVQPALSVPTEFPRDALDAFSSLNMPLPPRVESTDDEAVSVPGSLATPPVASPEITAQQAVAPHDPDDFPHVADEITAGTAGHAAVAGLGAAGFGALKLDFDLELPPSPAQPLPVFTRADLSRIARNKLDLAAEYIDLGDLSGARTLINEVIEANDPATRTEARALLSTLAPLS